MNIHKNARLTPLRRAEMAVAVIEGGFSKAHAARTYGVSAKIVTRWVEHARKLKSLAAKVPLGPDDLTHAAMDLLTAVGRRLRATDELLRTQVSRNPNLEEEERLTFGQRIADKVASFGGSWTFIILFGVVLAIWVIINSTALLSNHFDPYPYILLNLFRLGL